MTKPIKVPLTHKPDDAVITPYNHPEKINIVVVGGETSPVWMASDFSYMASASIDDWCAKQSNEGCSDGTCGLPDETVDYD